MSIPNPLWKKLFGSALIGSALPTFGAPAEEVRATVPDTHDRLCAKYDAARMIRQLRQRSGLSGAQFAARLGMKLKDVLVAEIGEADYQRTMDMRDRAQTMLGSGVGDPQVQPQSERQPASMVAAWIGQLPD